MKTLITLLCDPLTSLKRFIIASNLSLNFLASFADWGNESSVDASRLSVDTIVFLAFSATDLNLCSTPSNLIFSCSMLFARPSMT